MWDKTSELPMVEAADDALTDWAPTELSAAVGSRRKVRWPIVIGAVIVGLAAAMALWWMPRESNHRVTAHADMMRSALGDLHGDLVDTQAALATATEPTSTEPDLGSVALNLAGIADSSARLLDVANQPIPSSLPLTAREPFDDLDAFRQTLEPLAAEATAIRREVAAITDYRNALTRVLTVAELPLSADSATITEQAAALARVLATSVSALTEMPLDGPFAEHRALVDAEVTAFTQWQDDYLGALREGDTTEAGRLVDDLKVARDRLQSEIVNTLAGLRTEVDGRILDLAAALDRAIQLVP
jgi:DNA-binding FadR family transcriptional regulator